MLAFLSAAYVASGVFVGKRDGRGAGGGFLEAHPHYQQWQQAAGLVSDGISYARARGDGSAGSGPHIVVDLGRHPVLWMWEVQFHPSEGTDI